MKKHGSGTCLGRSLRDTRNSMTMLKTEGTFKSIRITPTILIHIFEWFFYYMRGFTVPHAYFHSPVHVSVMFFMVLALFLVLSAPAGIIRLFRREFL